MKNGLLVINLGTPKSSDVSSVRSFLAEFLRDRKVIDLPFLLRYLLVYGYILPFRSKKTAKAYQSIWTDKGSPLLANSLNLKAQLQAKLGSQWQVELGLRYGKPGIKEGLKQLSSCKYLVLLPLFPQYSFAATSSALEKTFKLIAQQKNFSHLTLIRDFYQEPCFINAQAALIRPHLAHHDYLLLSYHGLPIRHLKNNDCFKLCDSNCDSEREVAQNCYRAQCKATSQALAKKLDLNEKQFGSSFQSRLGKSPWIKPYTDEVLVELHKKGVKRLALCCPSFVADCLETLEEIGIRAKEQWKQLGGERLTLIPCLNDSKLWVEGLAHLVESKLVSLQN